MIELLQRQALLGLQGAAAPAQLTADPAIDACLHDARANATPAQALLRQLAFAATAARCQQAPARPLFDPALPVPDDPRPLLPAHAAALVSGLVRGDDDDELVAAVLRDVGRDGWRLPESLLVALLAHARSDAQRQRLAAIGGPRLAWLAAGNPAWAWCSAAPHASDPEQRFDLATGAERVAALRAWRERDPDAARARVQAGWRECGPDERAALLGAFAVGASLADEAFLEQALDDKRKPVRAAACERLLQLPGSQLVQRCMARILPLFACSGTPHARLEIALPAAHDKAMARDGIEAKPPPGRGERQHWLLQLLAAVPPAALAAHLAIAMPTLLRLLAAHGDRALLLHSVAVAASRQPDAVAIDAWFDVLDAHPLLAAQFLQLLAARALQRDGEARLQRLLADAALRPQLLGHLGGLLAMLPQPWSPAFSSALHAALNEAATGNDWSMRWAVGQCLLLAALQLEPQHGFDAWRDSAAVGTLSQRDVARYFQRLDLRAQIHHLTRSR